MQQLIKLFIVKFLCVLNNAAAEHHPHEWKQLTDPSRDHTQTQNYISKVYVINFFYMIVRNVH